MRKIYIKLLAVLVTSFLSAASVYADITVTTGIPFNIYEDTKEVEITLNYSQAFSEDKSGYIKVTDYFGTEVFSDTFTVIAGEEKTKINVITSDYGHYTVSAKVGNESTEEYFAVVKATDKAETSNSPIAADAVSTFYINESDAEGFARMAALAGIPWVRERINWKAIQTSLSSYDYAKHDAFINAFSKEGIKVMGVFHSAPSFMVSEGEKLPSDLVKAYLGAKNMAEHFKDKIHVWEIWNEPGSASMTSDSETANKYASFFKAMSAGFRDGNAKALISNGGYMHTPGMYAKWLYQNDITSYCDIYNMHFHQNDNGSINKYSSYVKAHRDFMEENNMSAVPLWNSESGLRVPLSSGKEDATVSQQKQAARYVPVSAISSLADGADKHFWFMLAHYNENKGSFGSLTSRNTPYSCYSSLAALCKALGNGIYEGELINLPSGVTGHVFNNDGKRVMCLWASEKKTVSLKTNNDTGILTDIMGNSKEITALGGYFQTEVSPDTVYIEVEGELPEEIITKKEDITEAEGKELTAAQKIILSQSYGEKASVDAKTKGYRLERNGEILTVEITNLNYSQASGTVRVEAQNGWKITPSQVQVTVSPLSTTKLEFKIDGNEARENIRSAVRVSGVFGGNEVSPSVAIISYENNDNIDITTVASGFALPTNWNYNYTGLCRKQLTEEGMMFDYTMFDYVADKWSYPWFNAGNSFAGTDGFGIDMVLFQPQTQKIRVMIKEEGGATYWMPEGGEIEAEENSKLRFFWEDFSLYSGNDENGKLDIDKIESISIGFNTSESEVKYLLKKAGAFDLE